MILGLPEDLNLINAWVLNEQFLQLFRLQPDSATQSVERNLQPLDHSSIRFLREIKMLCS